MTHTESTREKVLATVATTTTITRKYVLLLIKRTTNTLCYKHLVLAGALVAYGDNVQAPNFLFMLPIVSAQGLLM